MESCFQGDNLSRRVFERASTICYSYLQTTLSLSLSLGSTILVSSVFGKVIRCSALRLWVGQVIYFRFASVFFQLFLKLIKETRML